MIGLDTNILLRFILQDDPVQSPRAAKIFDNCSPDEPGWIAQVTLVEMVWVLSSSKGFDRAQVAAVIERLVSLAHVQTENGVAVRSALAAYRSGKADFADCVIAASARAAGCARVVTFDRTAARDAGMELLA